MREMSWAEEFYGFMVELYQKFWHIHVCLYAVIIVPAYMDPMYMTIARVAKSQSVATLWICHKHLDGVLLLVVAWNLEIVAIAK